MFWLSLQTYLQVITMLQSVAISQIYAALAAVSGSRSWCPQCCAGVVIKHQGEPPLSLARLILLVC